MPSSHAPNGIGKSVDTHVRSLPLSYDNKDSQNSALRLVTSIRPDWTSPDSNVEFIRFTDGITNTLLKAVNRKNGLSKEEIDAEAMLLRAYGHGTEVIIDRQREAQNHELLMKHGLAPELLARFENGMMYRFIRGRTTSPADLREPSIYKAVARRLAEWHAKVPCIASSPSANGTAKHDDKSNGTRTADGITPGKLSPNVWTVMQKWILAQPTETEEQRQKQTGLQKELDRLVGELSQRSGLGHDGLVFAHCDLLSGNVIVLPKTEASNGVQSETGSDVTVSFIDYEYATPSPAAFDIANHFAEWGGFDCDYSVLPTRAQRLDFIQEYIKTYYNLIPERPHNMNLEDEASKLLAEVDLYRGVPGFYWGIWACIQAVISEIDFDYASYAETRLGEYWAWRAEVEGTREAEGREVPLRERRWAQVK